ncbi:restriction endonuclease subunit S [Methanobacterium sp. SMA-27]|uniref:restriction endonuclease subunit S n=1 Tax=Methanobacterium sp. SMA-27 TaxID=1495336 RepID=UPI000694C266|nr:restriction endonuclease subunit S [Methanobacterium sp. SMA-27]
MSETIPKLRFPEFHGSWEEYELGNIAIFTRGPFGGSLKKSIFVDSGYKVYEQKNAIQNSIKVGKYFITPEKYNQMIRFSVEEGDLLVSCSGTIGKILVIPVKYPKGIINQALLKITVRPEVNNLYLKELLQNSTITKHIFGGRGAAIKNVVSVKELKKIRIFMPSKQEQDKILIFLSKLDGKIEKLEKKQELWKNFKNGIIQQLFSQKLRFKDENKNAYPNWEEKKLGDLAIFTRGPFGGSLKKSIFVDSGYKVYEQKNAIQNSLELGNYYITEEKYKEMIRFSVGKGDLLISCSGTIGKIIIIPDKYPKGIINQALLKVTVHPGVNNLYLKELLQSSEMTQHIFGGRGAAIKNVVSVKELKEIHIKFPSYPEQEKIVNFLSAINIKIKQLNKELKNNKKFKKGIMQQMFC